MDIVERLRNFETTNVDLLFLKNDAALEIERLRETIEKITDGIYIAKFYAEDVLKEKE